MVYTRKTIATSISGGGISGKIALQKNGNYEWQLLEKFVNVEELDGVKIPNQGGQLVLERVVDLPDYDTAAAQLKEAFKKSGWEIIKLRTFKPTQSVNISKKLQIFNYISTNFRPFYKNEISNEDKHIFIIAKNNSL